MWRPAQLNSVAVGKNTEELADGLGGPIRVLPWEERHDALDGVAMVVNTTSEDMVGQSALDLRLDRLPKPALAADIIYTPLETPYLAAARERGNRTVNGLGMLPHQGRPAWKMWFDIEPVVTAEFESEWNAASQGNEAAGDRASILQDVLELPYITFLTRHK